MGSRTFGDGKKATIVAQDGWGKETREEGSKEESSWGWGRAVMDNIGRIIITQN